jgi:hypothetical protein
MLVLVSAERWQGLVNKIVFDMMASALAHVGALVKHPEL